MAGTVPLVEWYNVVDIPMGWRMLREFAKIVVDHGSFRCRCTRHCGMCLICEWVCVTADEF
jgi:hypothetical protein